MTDEQDVTPGGGTGDGPATVGRTELDSLYREHAHLIALLIHDYKGAHQMDPDNPGWLLVYADLPTGQVSWHIAPEDIDLFENVRFAPDIVWDGHSTETKYGRIREAIGAGQ